MGCWEGTGSPWKGTRGRRVACCPTCLSPGDRVRAGVFSRELLSWRGSEPQEVLPRRRAGEEGPGCRLAAPAGLQGSHPGLDSNESRLPPGQGQRQPRDPRGGHAVAAGGVQPVRVVERRPGVRVGTRTLEGQSRPSLFAIKAPASPAAPVSRCAGPWSGSAGGGCADGARGRWG